MLTGTWCQAGPHVHPGNQGSRCSWGRCDVVVCSVLSKHPSSVKDAEYDVGLAVGAGGQSGGQEPAGFVAVDGAAAVAGGVAVAGVNLGRRASGADAELDDPLRSGGPDAPAASSLGFLPLQVGDLVVDARQPHRVPHPQGEQSLQVRWQVVEHVPLSILIAAGQRGDSPQFEPVLKAIRVPRVGPGRPRTRPDRVPADKAYASRKNRAYLRRRGIHCTIPDKADHVRNRKKLGSRSSTRPTTASATRLSAGATASRGTVL